MAFWISKTPRAEPHYTKRHRKGKRLLLCCYWTPRPGRICAITTAKHRRIWHLIKNTKMRTFFQHAALRRAIDDDDEKKIGKLMEDNPKVTRVASGENWSEGWSILHYAAFKGTSGIVDLLLKNRADPNEQTTEEQEVEGSHIQKRSTPLILAVEFNTKHPDVAEHLLQATPPASPDLADANGWTALHYAAKNGDTDTATALIKAHAKLDVKTNGDQFTSLNWPLKMGMPTL